MEQLASQGISKERVGKQKGTKRLEQKGRSSQSLNLQMDDTHNNLSIGQTFLDFCSRTCMLQHSVIYHNINISKALCLSWELGRQFFFEGGSVLYRHRPPTGLAMPPATFGVGATLRAAVVVASASKVKYFSVFCCFHLLFCVCVCLFSHFIFVIFFRHHHSELQLVLFLWFF